MIIKRETMEKMKKDGWEEFIKKQKNPSDYKRRLRENIKESLEDLVYLTAQLPYDEFFYDSVGLNLAQSHYQISDGDFELCSNAIETFKNLLMIEFDEINNKDWPTINQITKEYLNKASSICREIAIKIKADKLMKQKELSDWEEFQLKQIRKEQTAKYEYYKKMNEYE